MIAALLLLSALAVRATETVTIAPSPADGPLGQAEATVVVAVLTKAAAGLTRRIAGG